jgi:hypothetical protein
VQSPTQPTPEPEPEKPKIIEAPPTSPPPTTPPVTNPQPIPPTPLYRATTPTTISPPTPEAQPDSIPAQPPAYDSPARELPPPPAINYAGLDPDEQEILMLLQQLTLKLEAYMRRQHARKQ